MTIQEAVDANRARGYVFVWEVDAAAAEYGLLLFQALEAAGIDVVGEEEMQVPGGDEPWMINLREVESLPRLTRRREAELAGLIRSGGNEREGAQREFLEGNLRMAAFTAFRHTPAGPAMPDRITQAEMALAHAMLAFDFANGSRFSSFATWFVRRQLISNPNPGEPNP